MSEKRKYRTFALDQKAEIVLAGRRETVSMAGSVRLDSLLPAVVRRWLLSGDTARHRRVEASVLSADISGFTRLAERLATEGARQAGEALTEAINRCFVPMIDGAADLGGDIVKFGGDALFVLFESARHETRAAIAAAGMQHMITMLDVPGRVPLSMTVGVAAGEVDLVLGGRRRRELVVGGPTVDECLRLEGDAEPGEVLVSASVAEALPGAWVTTLDDGVIGLRLDLPSRDALGDTIVIAADAIDVDLDDEDEYCRCLATGIGTTLDEAVQAFSMTGGEVRVVTVGFVDVPTDRLEPDDIAAVVDRTEELCDRAGITFTTADVYEGATKLVLVAGAPIATGSEDDAMLGALTELIGELGDIGARAGANRGLGYAGFLGSDRYQTFTVMGDAVNLAARLMAKAEPGTVVASADVLARSRTLYETTERQPLLVRGKTEPVTVHQIGTPLGPAPSARPVPDLVGRTDEIEALTAALDRAHRGVGEVVELRGDDGVGKARLCDELVSVAPMGVLVLDCMSTPSARHTPWAAIRTILRGVAGIGTSDDADAAGIRVVDWLERTVPDDADLAPLLAPVFGAHIPPTRAGDAVEPRFRADRTAVLIADLLDATLLGPALLIARDIHWLDGASLRLLSRLAERATERPWLLVTTALLDTAPLSASDTRRPVEPLRPAEIEQLVAHVTDLPDHRRRDIAIESAGNPLFALELADGARHGEPPDSIEALTTARIDRLGHEGRVLLRTAAVIGDTAPIDLLVDVAGQDAVAGLPRLGELLDAADGDEFRFRSPVVREVAYAGLSSRRRKELHAAAAEALERRGATAAALVVHQSAAGLHDRAWVTGRQAARDAVEIGAMRVATTHYLTALESAEALGIDPTERRATELDLFEAGIAAGERAVAIAAGERALASTTDPLDHARLVVDLAQTRAEGDGSFAVAKAELLTEMATAGKDDPAVTAWHQSHLAGLCARLGEHDEAAARARAVLDAPPTVDTAIPRARAAFVLHAILLDRGDPEQFAIGEAAIETAEAAKDDDLLSAAHSNAGTGRQYSGDWSRAIDHYRRAIEIAERRGDTVRLFYPRFNEAVLRSDQGRWDEARPILDELRRSARYDATGHAHALALRELGRLEAHAGHGAAGREWLEQARHWFTEAGETVERLETEIALVECSLTEGRSDAVLAAEPALLELAGDEPLPAYLDGLIDHVVGSALLQRAEPEEAQARFESARDRTADAYPFNHALVLIGLSEAEAALGRNRTARTTRRAADEILETLGVVALPHVPLPR